MKRSYVLILFFCLPFLVSLPTGMSGRTPANAETADSESLWRDLYRTAKNFEKELDRLTFDVSNIEQTDETGALKARTPKELAILDLRAQIANHVKTIRKHTKRSENLSGAELDDFFHSSLELWTEWTKSPLFKALPSSLDERLRLMRDAAVPLLTHYQTERDLKIPAEKFTSAFPVRTTALTFRTANQVCGMLSAPGNIILRKALLIDGSTENDFSSGIMKMINRLESLKGGDQLLNYRHSELISRIENYNNIETISYYPWYFMLGKPKEDRKPMFMIMNKEHPEYFTYRSKYSVFRVRGERFDIERERREHALNRADARILYSRLGTCADFVNWTYGNMITSSWNQIPAIRRLIRFFYIPEAIQTPDNLADSPQTEKVCEVENSELLFPQELNAKDWVNRVNLDLRSDLEEVRKHAEKVMQFLVKNGVAAPSSATSSATTSKEYGEPLVETVTIQLRTARTY